MSAVRHSTSTSDATPADRRRAILQRNLLLRSLLAGRGRCDSDQRAWSGRGGGQSAEFFGHTAARFPSAAGVMAAGARLRHRRVPRCPVAPGKPRPNDHSPLARRRSQPGGFTRTARSSPRSRRRARRAAARQALSSRRRSARLYGSRRSLGSLTQHVPTSLIGGRRGRPVPNRRLSASKKGGNRPTQGIRARCPSGRQHPSGATSASYARWRGPKPGALSETRPPADPGWSNEL